MCSATPVSYTHLDVYKRQLVVDAMAGQDAVNVAKTFNEKVSIDGIILTKTDGDTRGGAALSVLAVTGKPIKFQGTGEKLDDLDVFHPDRMASRILGMGDVLSLSLIHISVVVSSGIQNADRFLTWRLPFSST